MILETKIDGLVSLPRTTAYVEISDSTITCEISDVTQDGDMCVATVTYPDGFTKSHQASDVAELLPKVDGTLRGRYGVRGYVFEVVPESIEQGSLIKYAEVQYGS